VDKALGRAHYFLWGMPLILIPAALVWPALEFLTICPPFMRAKVVVIALLALFSASEAWGITRMFRSFSRRVDIISLGSIFLSLIGLAALAFNLWLLTSRPNPGPNLGTISSGRASQMKSIRLG
jgi:hypothetical protein